MKQCLSNAGSPLLRSSQGPLLRRDHHQRRPPLWPPHEDLGIVGIGFDQCIGWDGLHPAQDPGLFLLSPAHQLGPLAQELKRVHLDVHPHPPLDGLQDNFLFGAGVHSHQPGGEALVPLNPCEQRNVTVAHRHCPRHAGVEVVIHADRESRDLAGGAHQSHGLSGVPIPWVADTV